MVVAARITAAVARISEEVRITVVVARTSAVASISEEASSTGTATRISVHLSREITTDPTTGGSLTKALRVKEARDRVVPQVDLAVDPVVLVLLIDGILRGPYLSEVKAVATQQFVCAGTSHHAPHDHASICTGAHDLSPKEVIVMARIDWVIVPRLEQQELDLAVTTTRDSTPTSL
jgi:hypothetical protein